MGNLLPGFRGVDHIGLTVPDIEQATEFFVEVLGAERFYSLGPFEDRDTDGLRTEFGIHPRSVVEQIRPLRLGNLNIELFQFSAPDQRTELPAMTDNGGGHVCLYVDDIDLALDYLSDHGVEVLGSKKPAGGPEAGEGAWWIYFRSPWGSTMELVTYPNGRAYEADHERPLWNPSRPGR